jgi:cytoskeleton protein RodZ
VGEFGNKFRKEREKKGISLEDVSNVTKISCRMLQAIEDEQFERLPGGVFNKGFIRAYAKHLGLNDEEAVSGYLECLHQSQLESQEVWDPQPPAAAPAGRAQSKPSQQHVKSPSEVEELPGLQLPRAEHIRPPRRDYLDRRESAIPWRIVALVVLVVVLGVLLWNRHTRSSRTQAASSAPPAISPSPANPPASPAISPAINQSAPAVTKAPSGTLAAKAAPASVRSPVPYKPSAPEGQAATHPSVSAPATLATPSADHHSAENVSQLPAGEENAPAAASVTPENSPSENAASAPLLLVIRASENSWISVSADGRPVRHELLIAPASTSVRAAREVVVKVGNAGGVTFLWNGQEIPAQGAEAEVKTLVFGASGIREVPASQQPAENR